MPLKDPTLKVEPSEPGDPRNPLCNPFVVMNTIRLIAFALVGSAKAIREEFALLEPIIVGLAMAFAGGATRNLLVTRIPLVLQSLTEISLGLLGVGLAIVLSVVLKTPETHPVTFIADAIALAALATTGTIVQRKRVCQHSASLRLRRSTPSVGLPSLIFYLIDRRSSSSRTSMQAVRSSVGLPAGSRPCLGKQVPQLWCGRW